MAGNWKDKTCEKCEFQVNKVCRKTPTRLYVAETKWVAHNEWELKYLSACSEYEEIK